MARSFQSEKIINPCSYRITRLRTQMGKDIMHSTYNYVSVGLSYYFIIMIDYSQADGSPVLRRTSICSSFHNRVRIFQKILSRANL
jgi:hypothetical protein